MAERFEVSRGPVRDAFRILEAQHLVEKSGRSYVVLGLENSDLDEIYQLRTAIEPLAWSYLRDRRDNIAELDAAIKQMALAAQAQDAEAFARADIDFHSVAVRLSGKKRVVAMWDQIEPSIRLILQVTNLVNDDFDNVLHKHEILLDALRKGTESELRSSVVEHIENSRRILP
ncbi:gluconate operon transcriptional repressor [Arthrobacter sp. Hiyo6]|nr:gluconate operon transcriptional repressor [Arthrobacter sp. Hiyo6]